MKTTSLLLMALISVASTSALAQYTGPGAKSGSVAIVKTTKAVPITDVRTLMASGKDDAEVSLQGRIVRRVGGDDYRFADATGEIDIEIDSEHWPANTPIDDKAVVKITGEFDKGLVSKPKVEVEHLEKVK